jgi:hypothetical protein
MMLWLTDQPMPKEVLWEIAKKYPSFYMRTDYGRPGRNYQYAVMDDPGERQLMLFRLQYGEYFAV